MALLKLDDILYDVLEIANQPHNQHYPIRTLNQHINLVTNVALDELVKLYPTNNSVVTILKPFIVTEELKVVNGKVPIPTGFRDYLGMGVYVRDIDEKSKGITPCTNNGLKLCELDTNTGDPNSPTVEQIKLKALSRTCRSNPVLLKSINEWDIATGHAYKSPTIENPISCVFEGDAITVCPYNIETVILRYVKTPKVYKYGYIDLPDGTIQFDLGTTSESEWEQTARQYINKAMSTLYSIFARDGEMAEGITLIKKIGFF